nr:hypothetical protein [Tanacetum cinerariifolium]
HGAGRRQNDLAGHAFGGVHIGRAAVDDHRATHQRRCLQRLRGLVHAADRIDRRAQVLHGFQAAELRQLRHELAVVLWIER